MHLLVGVMVMLLGWGSFSLTHAIIIDRIMAKVNGEIITLSQVQEEGYPLLAKLQTEFSGEELRARQQLVEQQMLERIIDRILQVQQARKRGLTVSAQEVDAALQDIMRQNNLTEEEFKRILAEEDIDYLEYRNHIEEQLLVSRLLNIEVRSKIRVDLKEIEEYYQRHRNQYGGEMQFRVRHILFLTNGSNGTMEKARENAQIVLEKLRNGEDFVTLARLYSQDPSASSGGDLGFLKQGEMLPAFEEALKRLEVGEISEPIQTKYGFHIIRLEEKRGGEQKPLEAVRAEIENLLINQKMQRRYEEWMKELRDAAYIERIQ